jgi:predicted RNA binding protein YcfA (HicA-like mRNA interferase family)
MSPKLPVLTGKEVVRIVEGHGFFFVSQKGSHAKYRNSAGKTTIIPLHGTEEIGPGLLLQILNDVGIDPKKLRNDS